MLHLLHRTKKKKSGHHHVIDYLAEGNALMNGIALYPQLAQVLRTHSAQGLSPISFAIMFVANIVWIAYGLHRKDAAVLLCSTLVIISSGSLFVLSFWMK